jgi:acyl-coenzyme A synthetase/AMP-(fatty) acid ligase
MVTQGHQVAPAELEAHILANPSVEGCVVIPVHDERAGEVLKAFVKANTSNPGVELARDISLHIQQHKARFKRQTGGLEFVDAIPKGPTGKILRRVSRDQELK